MRYIDCALVIPGLVCILATERRQRLGDLAAGTLVVVKVANPTIEKTNA
jgi:uncharacterized RDD family membrane protein YckC